MNFMILMKMHTECNIRLYLSKNLEVCFFSESVTQGKNKYCVAYCSYNFTSTESLQIDFIFTVLQVFINGTREIKNDNSVRTNVAVINS